MSLFSNNDALRKIFNGCRSRLSQSENLTEKFIEEAIDCGQMTLLGNINRPNVQHTLIGQPAKIKVNANIGTSPMICSSAGELEKLAAAEKAGADTFMDLSTGGDLDAIRKDMMTKSALPIGTVPIYAAAKRNADEKKAIEDMDMEEVFKEIKKQGELGVDFMTIHTGIDLKTAEYAENNRILGVVSRGGSMIASWMRKHNKENPFYENFDRIVSIAKKYNITLSLGDAMRPGALADAGDLAQIRESANLGEQIKYAREKGVQVMAEGPGHIPLDMVESQIKAAKKLIHNAPLYILGPLVIDNAAGYDHISGAIGAANAVMAGADFLCYLTAAEHLTLPDIDDVYNGVMASRIAAMAGDTALKRRYAVELQNNMSQARRALNWEDMKKYALDADMVEKRRANHKDREECAMCGEFCSVKLGNKN